jgi:hypothetical protein
LANPIQFFRSTGTDFTPFPAYEPIPASTVGARIALRDIDGDGAVDFLLDHSVHQRSWWSGTYDGGFPDQAASDVPLGASSCQYCFGDVNGDGHLDAISGTNELWINTSF